MITDCEQEELHTKETIQRGEMKGEWVLFALETEAVGEDTGQAEKGSHMHKKIRGHRGKFGNGRSYFFRSRFVGFAI